VLDTGERCGEKLCPHHAVKGLIDGSEMIIWSIMWIIESCMVVGG
jgi:hypothetical protein